MIENYIKFFESFKQNQISKTLEHVECKFFEILYSKHVSSRIAPYFPQYKVSFLLDNSVLEQGTLYVKDLQGKIAYTVLNESGEMSLEVKLEELDTPSPFSTEALNALSARIISTAARKGHIKWAPFINYSHDPDNISQIKKIINVLHLARLAFIDLENSDVRHSISNIFAPLSMLFGKTADLAYEASFLLTHLDVDLKDMFQEELAILLPLLRQIQSISKKQATKREQLIQALHPEKLSYKIGEVAGIATDQMRPLGGDVDYNFLTQFSAVLPSYIDQLTYHIQQYSTQIKESEPKLNQQKLDELQNSALELLNDIEHVKGNSIFISLKFLNYIYIIQNIITLSVSTFKQIGELSESSQDLIRDKLAQLKYSILPALFGLVDKIEDNAMLKPGTLSIPLMNKVKIFYNTLLYLPMKAIDFKTKGVELLAIEDSHFIELRLERSYARIDKANIELYKIQKVKEALKQFYNLLSKTDYSNFRLFQLAPEVKKELITHYKLIQPYLKKLDIDLNEVIISELTGPEIESWHSYLSTRWRGLKKKVPEDHVSIILEKQTALHDLIVKQENTQLFHIDLNKDIIDSVQQKADLVLFPEHEKTSIYSLNESIALKLELESDKILKLTRNEFYSIQNAYNQFARIIKTQIAKQPNLFTKDFDLNSLEPHVKEECRKVFLIFQPCLSKVVSPKLKYSAKCLERYLTELLIKSSVKDPIATELFLEIDKNITNYFTFLNYEWADNTEYQTILNAYMRFSSIINQQIQNNPQVYENTLLLTNLDDSVKEECRALYKVFQPYLKWTTSPEYKNSMQYFENYLTALLNNKPLDILEAPTTTSFIKLDKNILDSLTQWRDKSTVYYDLEKRQFLSLEESEALTKKREYDASFKLKSIHENKRVTNLEPLTAEQAIELHQWYKNKHGKFTIAQAAFREFVTLLFQEIKTNPLIEKNILLLHKMDARVKEQCRKLYATFQPYFIHAFSSNKKTEALKLDHFIVALLSNQEIDNDEAPAIHLLLDLDGSLKNHFTHIDIEWKSRLQTFFDLAEEKYTTENDAQLLKQEIANPRAHFVLQNTHYSKSIHEFRAALFEVTSLFNQTMRTELTPQESQVPFPEMEDDTKRLAQCKQACVLKDIFNSLYHLEGIALQLEKLNHKAFKQNYVKHLAYAYSHINGIIKLSKRLSSDPYLKFMAQELINKAQIFYASFQSHSDAYQEGPEQVQYGKTSVKSNSLWYILNAFYISPKHMRALNNNTLLSSKEFDELHKRAKKATLYIEGLINTSNSYFKLFLQTPNMVYLYRELTRQLNEFTTTTHDLVLDNLDSMRSSVLTPMLLEADRWENRLGLCPGNFSGPMRQILDEFYKGLLHSLDLNSPTHIALICDKKPLQERMGHTKKTIRYSKKYLKFLTKEYADIEHLYQCLHQYKEITRAFFNPKNIKESAEELQNAYKKSLPKLAKLKLEGKILIEQSPYPEDHQFDNLCNAKLKDYDPHFSEVEALVSACYHYQLGLKATCKMRLSTAEEKLVYLTELIKTQEQENLSFVQEYTTESFDKQLALLCSRHIGLQYTDKEYQSKLKQYLINYKSTIIEASKNTADINTKIENLLKEKISIFEKKHYAEYYHLDSVRVALADFKNYFSDSTSAIHNKYSLFESQKTLNEKTRRISQLDAIAENAKLTVKERLASIKIQVKDPNFSRIILAHKQINPLSFAYLKLCLLSLLESLHLYSPSRKKLLHKINDSINNPPKISQLTKRFGLFATDEEFKVKKAPLNNTSLLLEHDNPFNVCHLQSY